MNYGLPYKGSKNKIAEQIVSLLPPRTHFYDLFCGGCAITHAAMMTTKWEDFTINDLNWQCPTLFVDALNGKYKDDTRWISREDFFRLKDSDPYIAFVWSFGNNLRDYIYSREIEPLKRAIHYAIYFADYTPAADLGIDLSFIDSIQGYEKRYLAVKHYFTQSADSVVNSRGGNLYLQHHPQRRRVLELERTIDDHKRCSQSKRTDDLANFNLTKERTEWACSKKKRATKLLSRTLYSKPKAVTDYSNGNDKSGFTYCQPYVG